MNCQPTDSEGSETDGGSEECERELLVSIQS